MRSRVAILAGGFGTRLRAVTGDLPKPMAPILGKPVLQHQIELCRKHGFTEIALLVHYGSSAISDYFGDGSAFGVRLSYVAETEPRGTAGALKDALDALDDKFLVLYGDTYADVDLSRFWAYADSKDADGTLVLHPNDHPHDSDLVEVAEDDQVVAIRAYPHPAGTDYPNLVNAAMYVLKKAPLAAVIPDEGRHDLAKNTFVEMLQQGRVLCGYVTPEYIKDMGTPERLARVERDILLGLPERLSTRNFRQAVFLDRDGTLNNEVGHLKSARQLELLPSVAEGIHALNRNGVLAIGVTNQPVLARGDLSADGLRSVHARLDRLLGEGKAYLDRMYVCPHHPDRGFPGEVAELKIECDCRKPKGGLIDRAARELEIDRRKSWMVGDTTRDVLAGKRAGVRTILLRTGYAGRDYGFPAQPDYVSDSLLDAVQWILTGHAAAVRQLMPAALSFSAQRMILLGGPARSGKSTAAQVLREIFTEMGRVAHVVPLDAWLKPANMRVEGAGVFSRYDLQRCAEELAWLRDASGRVTFEVSYRDRKTGALRASSTLSVGHQDVLIVEGVPALAYPQLRDLSPARIHLRVKDETRRKRLESEYQWRGEPRDIAEAKIVSRESDEVPVVSAAAEFAAYNIEL